MTPESSAFFLQNLTTILVKVFMLVLILLYVIFAAVIVRQVQIMNRVVTLATFSPILTLIAFIHLLASIGLFLLALVLL